jgi:hypothetical protein
MSDPFNHKIPDLPAELHKARDEVIESVLKGEEWPESIESIYEWLAVDGWDAVTSTPAKEGMAINVNHFRDQMLNDEEFEYYYGDEEEITDEKRITYARMRMLNRLESGDDGDYYPSYSSYEMVREDGKSAVIGCTMVIIPGGPEPSWWGAYKTEDDFYKALVSAEIIPFREIKDIPDAEILSYWKKTAKKKKK